MTSLDRTRFMQAADVFLLDYEDEMAKSDAGERRVKVLVELWQSNGAGHVPLSQGSVLR